MYIRKVHRKEEWEEHDGQRQQEKHGGEGGANIISGVGWGGRGYPRVGIWIRAQKIGVGTQTSDHYILL